MAEKFVSVMPWFFRNEDNANTLDEFMEITDIRKSGN